MRWLSLIIPVGLLASLSWSDATAQEDPDYVAMAPGPGKALAYLLCSDCHAMRQVLERRYTRSGWRQALERMTVEFGMAELTTEERAEILGYLATHYGPGGAP